MKLEFQPIAGRILSSAVAVVCLLFSANCVPQSARDNAIPISQNTPVAEPNLLTGHPLRQEACELFFLNEEIGWVVSNGTLYGTRDGGEHWQRLYDTDRNYTLQVLFTTERKGWMTINEWSGKLAHLVLRTNDGGRGWQQLLSLESPIYKIDFVNQDIGYVRSRWEPVRKSSNAGNTWTELGFAEAAASSSIFEGLHGFFFIDDKRGWAYGKSIWRTSDGAETWTEVVADEKINGILGSAAFIDGKHGWIVGSAREIWRTTDGAMWQRISAVPAAQGPPEEITKQLPNNFTSVSFINSQKGWIAANDRTVLHSTDGGNTWSVIAVLSNSAKAIRFLTENSGWALDTEGQLLRTLDGGRSWNVQPLR